ncbi:asparagine synthase (glutamine-hydrolyzing) [Urechidicola vernalis]|uniref:asparagine synthase (glutamine-hydrolyzing) n=1 Tax=Urechidicola vernalis TaxID=3075600 RepID=A0ABU2Y363_9FLAO|nr:asparagine synthase (glutamine-hydrolyzing) [Urechidicola sp. P050]MDT0552266.1 asparagine synthase (glutamine-hydrolyzing) [Urechidicola sp. P050]
MCGFLGEFLINGTAPMKSNEFEILLSLSKQRGPDTTIIERSDNYQFGFNRLAVLDTSVNGNQPKCSPSGRYLCVINGEIYNFKELIDIHNITGLRSTSDSEVLVHMLDQLGVEQTILCLNGMFAIAILDTHTNMLFLTRDFAGIKPHFYGVSKHGVVFASQFNQIWKHPFFKDVKVLRQDIVKEYFGVGYMQAPNTIYKDIYQVNPGELLFINGDGNIQQKQLITFNKDYESYSREASESFETRLHAKLNESIKSQMMSDVSLATFLSGGIDSPLISAMAREHEKTIVSFTLGVDSEKYDEREAARAYAKHIGTEHQEEVLEVQMVLSSINTHFKHFTEPFGDYSSIPTYLISEQARKRHTVMLSGDGGDELFFGYPRMTDVLQRQWWFSIPFFIRKPLVRLLIKMKIYHSWAPYTNKSLQAFILSKQLHIPFKSLNNLFPNTSFSEEFKELYTFQKGSKKQLLHQLRWNEFYGHMQRVLIKVDRMSMAHGLEVRVPFLELKTIRTAWKYLPKFKNGKFRLKEVLKKMMRVYYPNTLISQKKKGFSVPVEDWLRNELLEDVTEAVLKKPIYGVSDESILLMHEYVHDFLIDKHHQAWGVWHIYAWQKWAISEELI